MDEFKEFQGKSLDEAIKSACVYFDTPREKLEIDIVQDAKNGIFGLVGARKALIKARRAVLRTGVAPLLGREGGFDLLDGEQRDDDRTRGGRGNRRPNRERAEKNEGSETTERAEGAENAEGDKRRRENRPERTERPARTERPERGDRVERAERPDRPERCERDRPERDRGERPAMAENRLAPRERVERSEVQERPDRAERPERTERAERPDRLEGRNRLARPERGERPADRPERAERTDPRGGRRPRPWAGQESRGEPCGNVAEPVLSPEEIAAAEAVEDARAALLAGQIAEAQALEQMLEQDDVSEGYPEVPFDSLDPERLEQAGREVACGLVFPILGEVPVTVTRGINRLEVHVECGDDSGLLIGREGQTLAALQYLASRMVSRGMNAPVRVQFDVGDYRERQDERLRELAWSLAERVRETGRSCSTRPMSSYHRRIIHMTLQDEADVQTRSSGEGALKRVVVQRRRGERRPGRDE